MQLAELVEEAFEDAQVLARPHGVPVVLGDCTGNLMTGDRRRQLLLILTDNAVKYNVPSGGIEISLRHVDGMAELKITNIGEGIAQEMIDHVFDRFARGKNAQSKTEGCGLGLTIAQWIVLAHGGTIRLLDEGGGKTTALGCACQPKPARPAPASAAAWCLCPRRVMSGCGCPVQLGHASIGRVITTARPVDLRQVPRFRFARTLALQPS